MSDRIKELKADIDELKNLCVQATRKAVIDELTLAVKRVETRLTNEIESLNKKEEASKVASRIIDAKVNSRYTKEIKTYAWDQSDKFMKIYVTLPSVHEINAENVQCLFEKRSLNLHVVDLKGNDHNLSIVNIYADIDISKSYLKIKKDSVLLMLKKVKESETWSHVKQQKKIPETKKPNSDDPSSGIMDLLKNMYDSGDDSMKRTINKAWSESREKGDSGMPSMPPMT